MIYVESALGDAAGLDDAAVLVAALDAAGVPATLLRSSMPGTLPFGTTYDVARHLAHGPAAADDVILLLQAQQVSDARLADLRRMGQNGARCVAAGVFKDRQAELTVRAKLGYALGREPEMLSLRVGTGSLLEHASAPVFGIDHQRVVGQAGRLRLLLVDPTLDDPVILRGLQALAASQRIGTTVLTDGKTKTALLGHNLGLPIYHFAEAPAGALPRHTDIAVFCRALPKSYRFRMLLADLARMGTGLLDATDGFSLRMLDPAFVPAPKDPAALANFLVAEILPVAADLQRLVLQGRTAAESRDTFAALTASLGVGGGSSGRRVPPTQPAPHDTKRVVFMPTNGVGLGHAQRCSLIASQMDRTVAEPVFAAFPSCGRMLKSYGFDVMPLVSKTALHAEQLGNDVVNYQRIDGLVARSSAFVFDGGYVFNSVFRAILGNGTPSAWIRRGLWQGSQDNTLALEREKVFDRVIVPQEAFAELNAAYSRGDKVQTVGPIVQQVDLDGLSMAALRGSLAERFRRPFTSLVVTMLGGGVAADHTAQTVALAAMLARRPEVLHLVVVWPTSTVDPGLFGWPNTRVVKTHRASILAAAADLYVSAAGYNSFHEALYNRIPTIFIPQMAAYMDDQRARAAAAAERGLAILIEPHELMSLEANVHRSLDGGADVLRQALAGNDLPETGNTAAARLVCELAGISDAPSLSSMTRRVA